MCVWLMGCSGGVLQAGGVQQGVFGAASMVWTKSDTGSDASCSAMRTSLYCAAVVRFFTFMAVLLRPE